MVETSARELVIRAFQKARRKDSDYLARLLTDWLGLREATVWISARAPYKYAIRVPNRAQAQRIVDNFGGDAKQIAAGYVVSGFVVDLTS